MSTKHDSRKLKDLYLQIDNSEVVLPNFQRGYVWDESKQKSLIASFIVQIPIGSTLHLKGDNNDFSARSLCEIDPVTPKESCEYVLDGQQRLSTLKNTFYDLYHGQIKWSDVYSKLFPTIKNRWFLEVNNQYFGYENLKFDESILKRSEPWQIIDYIVNKKITDKKKDFDLWYHPAFTPLDEFNNPLKASHKKIIIKDFSCKDKIVPLYELFLSKKGIHRRILECIAQKRTEELQADVNEKKKILEEIFDENEVDIEYIKSDNDALSKAWITLENNWVNDVSLYLESLMDIEMPIILLPNKEIGRAAAIFEEINKGGLALSTYDLIVAKSAKYLTSGKTLTQTIIDKLKENITLNKISSSNEWNALSLSAAKENELSPKFHEIFLGALSLIINCKIHNKPINKDLTNKSIVLQLDAKDINDTLERTLTAIIRAYVFLQFRCGIINEKNIRYVYMVLPLVYLLDDESVWKDDKKLNYLEAWYWSSFFSGEYKERQDEKLVNNIQRLNSLLLDDKIHDEWVENGECTFGMDSTLLRHLGYSDIETLTHTNKNTVAPKAMEDAILQFELSQTPQDFIPSTRNILTAYTASCLKNKIDVNEKCKIHKLEIHHIIPLADATKIGERSKALREDKAHVLNSPLNLSYISECANRTLGSMKMNEYIKELGGTILDHFLTTEDSFYEKKPSESNDEYYLRCINKRFYLLQDKLKSRIRQLLR